MALPVEKPGYYVHGAEDLAVPEFHRFFRPILEILADGQARHVRDVEVEVARRFHLTEAELSDLLPSGRKTRVTDRSDWALTYLRQARLVESTGRGISRITDRGREYLRRAPEAIRPTDLHEFPEFVEFRRRSRPDRGLNGRVDPHALHEPETDSVTPDEAIGAAFGLLSRELARSVLEHVKAMPPAFFERLIVQLMLKLGYGGTVQDSGKTLGRSGDGGVDGVIKQDKLGMENVYLQAKRWGDGTVGRKEVQAFVGALSGHRATKGVFITTSSFTKEAQEYAAASPTFKVSLINGLELAELMIEYDLGVARVRSYDLKRVDPGFFTES